MACVIFFQQRSHPFFLLSSAKNDSILKSMCISQNCLSILRSEKRKTRPIFSCTKKLEVCFSGHCLSQWCSHFGMNLIDFMSKVTKCWLMYATSIVQQSRENNYKMADSQLPRVDLECWLEWNLTKNNYFFPKASRYDSKFRPGTEEGGVEVTHFSCSRVKPHSKWRKDGISFRLSSMVGDKMSCRNCDILIFCIWSITFLTYWENQRCKQVKHRVKKTCATWEGHE